VRAFRGRCVGFGPALLRLATIALSKCCQIRARVELTTVPGGYGPDPAR
jgi:hypothetical protein